MVDNKTYAIALHEIGHQIAHTKRTRTLDKEVLAWTWAIQNALTWTKEMTEEMRDCLITYIVSWQFKRSTRHPAYKLVKIRTRDMKTEVCKLKL